MRTLVLVALLLVLVGVGMKLAGIPIPYIDYTPSIAGPDVERPDIRVEPPGFDDFPAP